MTTVVENVTMYYKDIKVGRKDANVFYIPTTMVFGNEWEQTSDKILCTGVFFRGFYRKENQTFIYVSNEE